MENPNFEIHDCDWEIIPNSDENRQFSTDSSSAGDFDGVIRSDYFALDSGRNEIDVGDVDEEDNESDDPNWVDPNNVTLIVRGDRGFDSSSPSSESNSSDRNLLYSIQNHSECCGLGFSGFDHLRCSNPSEIGQKIDELDDRIEQKKADDQLSESNFENKSEERNEIEGEDEKKSVVWWKIPVEVLKYCVMKVNPMWSLSMAAAALMGFVILRRRFLNRMKRKSLGIQLKVTVDDDKKVSQFMSRAARLNEAFSVVKRVPMIRPALPAPGMAPWPVMSMR